MPDFARFAFRKLIVARERGAVLHTKRQAYLTQAARLFAVLVPECTGDVRIAWDAVRKRGPGRRRRIRIRLNALGSTDPAPSLRHDGIVRHRWRDGGYRSVLIGRDSNSSGVQMVGGSCPRRRRSLSSAETLSAGHAGRSQINPDRSVAAGRLAVIQFAAALQPGTGNEAIAFLHQQPVSQEAIPGAARRLRRLIPVLGLWIA